MLRTIIKIDQGLCVGCGLCASACHEGAIGMQEGKATLLRDDYCDGLGNCLPVCPTGAISFEEREAGAYNRDAAPKRVEAKQPEALACGCSGTHAKRLVHEESPCDCGHDVPTRLAQWPVQIKLAPIHAPYFENADLLIAADCTAYAYGNFHNEFIKGKITLIGCPKLDEGEYSAKVTQILKQNHVRSVTVVRMEVPCCSGIVNAAQAAVRDCAKQISWRALTLSTDGKIVKDERGTT